MIKTEEKSEAAATKDHRNYFGRTTEVFLDLGKLKLAPDEIQMEFHAWPSIESFENGDPPLAFMRRQFLLTGVELVAFNQENEVLIRRLTDSSLELIGIDPKSNDLEHFEINTTDKVLIIIARKPNSGGRRRVETLSGIEFDNALAMNTELVQDTVTLAWTYGIAKDSFLGSLLVK